MPVVTPIRILYGDGDHSGHTAVRSALVDQEIQWDLVLCATASELLNQLVSHPSGFDLVLCDDTLLEKSSVTIFRKLRQAQIIIPFVILIRAGAETQAVEALKAGVDNYLIKDDDGAYLKLLPVVLHEAVHVYQDRLAWKTAEAAIQKAHDDLELRVRERTEELSRVNETLRKEMDVRHDAEEALRQSIERFNLAVQGSQDGLWEGHPLPGESWQSPHTPMWFSPTFLSMLGFKADEFPPVLSSWSDLLHPDDADRVFRALIDHIERRIPYDVEYRLQTKSGEYRWFRARGQAIWNAQGLGVRMAGSLRDITDRKRAEEALQQSERQLRQAQKMEAIGTLAGGIAHDFNNILSAILGYAELALMNTAQKSLLQSYVSEVITAGTRARELVKQILAFSRETEQERRSVNLHEIVSEALRLLRPALPTSIDIRQAGQSKDSPCIIHADPTQIHQVLMNLCTNAEAAMRKRGGVLEIAVTSEHVNKPVMYGATQLIPGNYARLTVSDTGEGIDPQVLDRIFDPFFTTKPLGEGTGMGLAVVHGIVMGHGGTVTATSTLELGSRFDVFLPCLGTNTPPVFEDDCSLPNGKGTILFVDDEESITRWGEQLLTYLGYDVVSETSAQNALELFRRQPFQYDLVVTDQTMPLMTGEMLASEVLKIRKDIPIILCTGYSHAMSLEKSRAMGIRAFLMKPVKAQQLAMTLKEIFSIEERRNVSDPVV